MRAAVAYERDPAVHCPDNMAAGFLGGLNISTLAKHRATWQLVVRAVNGDYRVRTSMRSWGQVQRSAELRKAVAEGGEPLRWGIPEGRVQETLSRFGLKAERSLDGEEGRAAYLTRSDDTLHDQPYVFGVLVHAHAS